MTLRTNIPTRVGQARLVAGNIWEEDYTAEGGGPSHGLTALISVVDSDDAEARYVRVHPGQAFEIAGARVQVVSIDRSGVAIDVHEIGGVR